MCFITEICGNTISVYMLNSGKTSGWAVKTAYSDTPFKPIVKKPMEWQWERFEGGQATIRKQYEYDFV